MPKDTDRFKSFDTMLPQGARSRFTKAMNALGEAEDLLPDDALDGNAADLRQVILHLQKATENLSEMMAYRKMLGVD